MGYTHYWENREFTAEEWDGMTAAAHVIVRRSARAGIKLRGWDGVGHVCIGEDEISFNGDEQSGEDFESFRLTRKPASFEFCKTGHRPYDAAVVAVLMVAAGTGTAVWRSDGDAPDHEQGAKLAKGFAVKPAAR